MSDSGASLSAKASRSIAPRTAPVLTEKRKRDESMAEGQEDREEDAIGDAGMGDRPPVI